MTRENGEQNVRLPTRQHVSYVECVNGGYDGYRAQCWDCDWKGPIHEHKDDARPAAIEHEAFAPQVAYCPRCEEAVR